MSLTFTNRPISTIPFGTWIALVTSSIGWGTNICAFHTWETRLIVFYACVDLVLAILSSETRGTSAWQKQKWKGSISLIRDLFVVDALRTICTWTKQNKWAELRWRVVAVSYNKHGLNLSIKLGQKRKVMIDTLRSLHRTQSSDRLYLEISYLNQLIDLLHTLIADP